jgi:acetoin utilization deacetylase AcuC-like enzyme
VFNDGAIAALPMQAEGPVRRTAILDCDVHRANGTASIFADDPTVFIFSIHGVRNFPLRKETSDLDIELPDGTVDADYMNALQRGIYHALSAAQPKLAIYLAGADP